MSPINLLSVWLIKDTIDIAQRNKLQNKYYYTCIFKTGLKYLSNLLSQNDNATNGSFFAFSNISQKCKIDLYVYEIFWL